MLVSLLLLYQISTNIMAKKSTKSFSYSSEGQETKNKL